VYLENKEDTGRLDLFAQISRKHVASLSARRFHNSYCHSDDQKGRPRKTLSDIRPRNQASETREHLSLPRSFSNARRPHIHVPMALPRPCSLHQRRLLPLQPGVVSRSFIARTTLDPRQSLGMDTHHSSSTLYTVSHPLSPLYPTDTTVVPQ
jgi:hypothetical protein